MIIIEIQILNSLNKIGEEDIETKFGEILERYPEVVVILPNILAVRDKKLDVLDLDSGEFKNIEFKSKKFNKDEIINFCKGLI
ncbi:DpnII family type II restriction endonuclease [Methanobrevibacter ruminantium]|uniref:DpnII family type II restriction endonuclease n=1 Tax=Methanobrevibacter ruminantium TaxID=83816 RepID=UPI003F0516C5